MPMTREEVTTLALTLMAQHGLTANGWRFRLNSNRSRLGVCKFARAKGRGIFRTVIPVKRIELSVHHALKDSVEEVTDTILHEIAHALVGTGKGHGPEWKRVAREIGCKAQRCGVMDAPAKYLGTCGCGATFKRNRVTERMYRLKHTQCLKKGIHDKGTIHWRTAAGRMLGPTVTKEVTPSNLLPTYFREQLAARGLDNMQHRIIFPK